jgi:hypothetical protein
MGCYWDGDVDENGDAIDHCDGWICLQQHKLDDCGPTFIESIRTKGVQAPICVQITEHAWNDTKRWIQGNGNHRLSAMMKYDPFGEIPVVFSETRDYMRSDVTEDWGNSPDSYS